MAVQLTEDQWKEKLGPERYRLLRKKGTEQPFTGSLLANKETGEYDCAACGAKIFASDTKFDSNSGWPAFYDIANKGALRLDPNMSFGYYGIGVSCANCGSHLGHVFDDAPDKPTGLRYCVNSGALDFKKQEPKKS
ncbi:MAG TPA: peptide-methionine (R)-S-oxide reductase MsrB [Candidatus Saccharimonadales bacterium]|jgi:peptide-methionine (R)-S-oxide reductase|nr:peptide-methionine (R)-S-oxide reductase MsrB [Candidatus Saccharimonadales bacterium]